MEAVKIVFQGPVSGVETLTTKLALLRRLPIAGQVLNKALEIVDWETAVMEVMDLGIRIPRFLWHHILKLLHSGRGRSVPVVADLVLLKSATVLAREIREGKLKSEDLVRAYIRRIEVVEPYINAVAERRFQKALEEARAVDSLLASGKMKKERLAEEKPLLGIPFTVKANLTVNGMPCTGGSLYFKDLVAGEDSVSVARLKAAGGIVLATTNIPEMCTNIETNNHLYGKTCNPYDTSRTCGGSSGGEGALVGAAGSLIGIGNDIGGSIRIPSLYNGIFGHKPSKGMVSNEGIFPLLSAQLLEFFCIGPMCRYAEDLVTLMKAFTARNANPPKFYSQVDFRKLKIYYMTSLRNVPLAAKVNSENKEALLKVVSYFNAQYGVKAVEAKIPLLKHCDKLCLFNLLSSDPNIGNTVTGIKGGVNVFKEVAKFVIGKSNFTMNVIGLLIATKLKFIFRRLNADAYEKTMSDIRRSFEGLLDKDSVFLLPTLPMSAHYHYESLLMIPSVVYTGIFNFLGLPATQCPLGLNSEGLPTGIQVIGKMGNDPLTIAVALELEKAFGGWVQPTQNCRRLASKRA